MILYRILTMPIICHPINHLILSYNSAVYYLQVLLKNWRKEQLSVKHTDSRSKNSGVPDLRTFFGLRQVASGPPTFSLRA